MPLWSYQSAHKAANSLAALRKKWVWNTSWSFSQLIKIKRSPLPAWHLLSRVRTSSFVPYEWSGQVSSKLRLSAEKFLFCNNTNIYFTLAHTQRSLPCAELQVTVFFCVFELLLLKYSETTWMQSWLMCYRGHWEVELGVLWWFLPTLLILGFWDSLTLSKAQWTLPHFQPLAPAHGYMKGTETPCSSFLQGVIF